MFDPDSLSRLKARIAEQTAADQFLLDQLRADVQRLKSEVRTIRPRSTTAVSLVASDGGNNRLVFDPFYVQVVRVVDSYGKEMFLDVVSPSSDPDRLSESQFDKGGEPRTALGRMMKQLGVATIHELSHMIPSSQMVREHPERVSPSWVLVFRDLCEWAVLFDRICNHHFATDTLIVRDGLLRSKVFRGDLFIRWRQQVEAAISRVYRVDKRRLFLVGMAKHSKVLQRYSLAMALEGVLPPGEARYVPVPRDLERKAVRWQEWTRGAEAEEAEGEAPKFVAGDLFFVRFGPRAGDPVWPVDIFSAQCHAAPEIFGYLLGDARDGFPVPYYPRCLQQAHEHAELVDFDMTILQDHIFAAIRGLLPADKQPILEAHRLKPDAAGARYE